MIAYKFLAAGAVGPFTGFAWPVGEWVTANGPIEDGIHACRARDLAYWIDAELWTIELAGEVVQHPTQVTSRKARLVAPVAAWTAEVRAEHARACVLHARDGVAASLAARGRAEAAAKLSAAADPGAVAEAAAGVADGGKALAYLQIAAANHAAFPLAGLSWVTAMAVGTAAADPERVATERAWQSAWLARRLGLGA